jgi:hypothetical protein
MMVRTRQRRWAGLLVAVLVAAGTQVGVQTLGAAPASATVYANLSTATSASNSEPVKTAVARCPAGDRVFGGGAQIINGGGGVTLATMLPFHGNGDGYSVAATERPGAYLENWSVKAYAICGPAIPGMEIVTSVTTGERKTISAICPEDKVVVGAGAAVGATRQGALLYEVTPNYLSSVGYNVHVGAYATPANPPPDFAVIAAAVCAHEPDGYEIRERLEVADGDVTVIDASTTCNGRIALAAGAGFSSDIGFMTSMYTNLFVVRSQARKARQAPSDIWVHTVWAICVN